MECAIFVHAAMNLFEVRAVRGVAWRPNCVLAFKEFVRNIRNFCVEHNG